MSTSPFLQKGLAKTHIAPSIASTTADSALIYKIVFTEPVTVGTTPTLRYVGGSILSTTDYNGTISNDGLTYTLKLGTGVTAGKAITVTFASVHDYDSNLSSPNPLTTTVTRLNKDDVAPYVVSVTQASAKSVDVIFSEKLAGDPTITIDGVKATVTADASNPLKYTATVGTVNKGLKAVYISNFTDSSGEDGTATTKFVTFTEDTTAPTFAYATVTTVNGVSGLNIYFSEAVTANVTKVTVSGSYLSNNVTHQFASTCSTWAVDASDQKLIRIPLTTLLSGNDVAGAVYNISISGGNDPLVKCITGTGNQILVTFSEPVQNEKAANAISVLNNTVVVYTANKTYTVQSITNNGTACTAGVTYSTLLVTLTENLNATNGTINFTNLKDAAGNQLAATAISFPR